MDAPCKIQGSIHVFRLVNNMCPGKWVHIILVHFGILLNIKKISTKHVFTRLNRDLYKIVIILCMNRICNK